jgi:DNA-binding CsgD family transcriptional regulator/putative methionine-R-sulfoxide reductase with GAF domain
MSITTPNEVPEAAVFRSFMEFLTMEPNPNAVCHHIVMNWILKPAAVFAGLRLVSPDATIKLTGFFGAAPECVQSCLIGSLWEDTPSSLAIRQRKPLVLPNRAAIEDHDKQTADMFPQVKSLIVIPLFTSFQAVGSLDVIFSQEQTDAAPAVEFLSWFGHALTLYATNLTNTTRNNNHNNETRTRTNPPPKTHERERESHHVPLELSARQLNILQLMSQGFTNRRIAMRLGFSESTIRQESMNIYAFLKVSTRKEAVEQGILRALIEQPDDDY